MRCRRQPSTSPYQYPFVLPPPPWRVQDDVASDIRACVDFARKQYKPTSLGLMGFCYGGGRALEEAAAGTASFAQFLFVPFSVIFVASAQQQRLFFAYWYGRVGVELPGRSVVVFKPRHTRRLRLMRTPDLRACSLSLASWPVSPPCRRRRAGQRGRLLPDEVRRR